jgi:integrase
VKSVKSTGIRVGNWLSLRQVQALLSAPDIAPAKGLGVRAILAVLLGCGLRRSEVAALTLAHIQQRGGRWCIVDLVGKHSRVRTVPMPTWVKVAIDEWTAASGVAEGRVFRPVNRGDKVQGEAMSEKVVWQMLQPYATDAGVPGIAPHDCRRSCSKLCRAAGGELEQIQLLLGHAKEGDGLSVPTRSLHFQAAMPNRLPTNRAWPAGSAFATLLILPFRIMLTASIPCNVRQALRNEL